MFEQSLVNAQVGSRKPWTVAASLTLQIGFVAAILILPLLHPGTITPRFDFHTPLQLTKLTPPPLPPETRPAQRASRVPFGVFINPLVPSRRIPSSIDTTPDAAPELVTSPVASSAASALTDYAATRPVEPPKPVPPPVVQRESPAVPDAPIRVSSGIVAAMLIFGPKPLYPPIARTARIQGTVRLEAVIGRDGTIQNLRVAAGPPLLIAAAMKAVQQWRYKPTLLNGVPVEVITGIDVTFTLN